jgi:hypothetical protein
VKGHIFEDDVLKEGYYVFNSHAATWVPATQKYYDPMATIFYASLDPYIECELNTEENEFTPKTQPKTLCTHYDWKLIRRDEEVPGGFYKLDLVEV